jgi:hypothetical protein
VATSVKHTLLRPCQCAIIKTGFDHRFYHREIWGNVEVVRSEKRMISNVKNFRPGVFTLKFGEVIFCNFNLRKNRVSDGVEGLGD